MHPHAIAHSIVFIADLELGVIDLDDAVELIVRDFGVLVVGSLGIVKRGIAFKGTIALAIVFVEGIAVQHQIADVFDIAIGIVGITDTLTGRAILRNKLPTKIVLVIEYMSTQILVPDQITKHVIIVNNGPAISIALGHTPAANHCTAGTKNRAFPLIGVIHDPTGSGDRLDHPAQAVVTGRFPQYVTAIGRSIVCGTLSARIVFIAVIAAIGPVNPGETIILIILIACGTTNFIGGLTNIAKDIIASRFLSAVSMEFGCDPNLIAYAAREQKLAIDASIDRKILFISVQY